MKKIFYNLLLIMIFLFPINVFASGNITVSPSSLTIEEGKTKTFTITATNAIGDVSIKSSNSSVATINASEWETGMVEEGQTKTGTITVTGVSAGTATITLTLDAATFDSEDLSGQTRTVSITVKKISTNNNLSSIKIDGTTVSGFNASTTSYTIQTEKSYIDISAVAEDSTAKIAGTGSKTLKFGDNKFEIKVTAENGSVKTYTVNINRKDTRDTNNNLLSLTIDKGKITFNKNTTSYTLNVDSNVDKVTINATAESTKSKVAGTGSKTLKYGSNKFEIKVTAENDSVKTYTVTINRKDTRETNNNLSNLTIDKGTLTFNKNTTSYTLNVDNDVEKVTINATAESKKAKVTGTGEKTLKTGENKFEIKVTAENDSVKTYTITINKLEKGESNYIKSLSIDGISLNFNPNILEYNITITDQTSLKFNYELEEGVIANIEGNNDLKDGSIITLKLTKDDKSKEYKFNVSKQNEITATNKENINNPGTGLADYIIIVLLIIPTLLCVIYYNKCHIKNDIN